MSFKQASVRTLPAWVAQTGPTPLGPVWLAVSERGLVAVVIGGSLAEFQAYLERLGFQAVEGETEAAGEAARQMADYLAGRRSRFELPIDWERLPPFQRQVLQATFAIPYGSTATYAGVAREIGRPKAARAVGRAEATNPMPLVIPCHRVLGSDGRLHGYGGLGGLQTKSWLLSLEKDHQAENQE
jgi:methylated-DNA-[protein]-cysteine S-methyltransferase